VQHLQKSDELLCYKLVRLSTPVAVGDCWLVNIWKVVAGFPASGLLLLLSD
jgi:hypothetical protein